MELRHRNEWKIRCISTQNKIKTKKSIFLFAFFCCCCFVYYSFPNCLLVVHCHNSTMILVVQDKKKFEYNTRMPTHVQRKHFLFRFVGLSFSLFILFQKFLYICMTSNFINHFLWKLIK